ncbi:hypothetical protein LCGC14_0960920 [marine sediment metagenome]|uniref:HNH nuclease domain-containing protein n=1 Tax=marine sediment metagenome TaxID=412755 RepID=A0A0F9QXQ8_9ZZZZ
MTRRYLTPKRKAELWQQQSGGCAHCRAPLVLAHADHKNPLWCTGTNDADNWQLLCIPCHGAKTKREAAARAKAKRLERRRWEALKKPKGRKMQSRGFDTRLRKRMDGRVEVRG